MGRVCAAAVPNHARRTDRLLGLALARGGRGSSGIASWCVRLLHTFFCLVVRLLTFLGGRECKKQRGSLRSPLRCIQLWAIGDWDAARRHGAATGRGDCDSHSGLRGAVVCLVWFGPRLAAPLLVSAAVHRFSLLHCSRSLHVISIRLHRCKSP